MISCLCEKGVKNNLISYVYNGSFFLSHSTWRFLTSNPTSLHTPQCLMYHRSFPRFKKLKQHKMLGPSRAPVRISRKVHSTLSQLSHFAFHQRSHPNLWETKWFLAVIQSY